MATDPMTDAAPGAASDATAAVSIAGRVAVVTGGGRGMGRGIARALAGAGARVAVVARSQEQLAETERLIREAGGEAEAFEADVSRPESVALVQKSIEGSLGAPTILVNAAGVFGPISLIKDSDPADWIQTLMIDAVAPYLTSRAFAAGMIEAGWGRIVNITSAASLHPPGPLNSAYATAKVALNQLTRHLAAELAGTGVTANVIHPGDVKTDMWADIRDKVEQMGPEAEAYRQWVRWVDETGGDPPEKAADLVLRIVTGPEVSGRFLWVEDPLQPPIPSWDEPGGGEQPWKKSDGEER
jgi:NAD(P)-dependent dehydrogenase (short-subunit alcohol dehydrogenase family)